MCVLVCKRDLFLHVLRCLDAAQSAPHWLVTFDNEFCAS